MMRIPQGVTASTLGKLHRGILLSGISQEPEGMSLGPMYSLLGDIPPRHVRLRFYCSVGSIILPPFGGYILASELNIWFFYSKLG